MSDPKCLKWVIPAISAGFAVVNDPCGKLKFWTDDVTIVWRAHEWIASDGIDPDRHYQDLRSALESEG